jgi:transposase
LDASIENLLRQEQEIIARLDDTPGINRRIAEIVIAEAGTDVSPFPNQYHFASWIGLCPGENESAGKRKSAKTRKGNRALRCASVEAAQGALRKKDSYYGAQYRRIAARRGKKRALVALAHSIAIAIYHILKAKTAYRELGANFFDTIHPLKALNRLTKRIESLGYHVSVTVADMAA